MPGAGAEHATGMEAQAALADIVRQNVEIDAADLARDSAPPACREAAARSFHHFSALAVRRASSSASCAARSRDDRAVPIVDDVERLVVFQALDLHQPVDMIAVCAAAEAVIVIGIDPHARLCFAVERAQDHAVARDRRGSRSGRRDRSRCHRAAARAVEAVAAEFFVCADMRGGNGTTIADLGGVTIAGGTGIAGLIGVMDAVSGADLYRRGIAGQFFPAVRRVAPAPAEFQVDPHRHFERHGLAAEPRHQLSLLARRHRDSPGNHASGEAARCLRASRRASTIFVCRAAEPWISALSAV